MTTISTDHCHECEREGGSHYDTCSRHVRARLIAYRCPECCASWTVDDDPNEWAYGHDCEG